MKQKIKDICEKGSSNLKQKELLSEGKYPVFGAGGLSGYLNTYHQEREYIGIVKDGSGIGRVDFYPAKTSLIGTMQYIIPLHGFNIRYIGYCLQSLDLSKHKQGAAIPHIYFRDYGEQEVNITSDIAEQEEIVSRLDKAFEQIETMRRNAEQSLTTAQQLFQSTLTHLLTPQPHWERKMFNELCDFVRGPFGGSLKKDCFKSSGYAVYEQQNAIYNRFTFRYFIDKEKYESMKRFEVSSGDLIMSCSGTIGKVAIITDVAPRGIINQALLKLTPKKAINSLFLKLLMESDVFKETISNHSDGAAIKNIAAVSVLKGIYLTIPPLPEQSAIVAKLDSLSSKVKQLKDNYTRTVALCDEMKQALLKEVFED